jgi:hypothetical protein
VDSIYEIDLQQLKQQNVRGIICDLDNTLVSAKTPHATPELVSWLNKVREEGFKVVILSNNNLGRVGKFAEPLGIPFVHAARKPIGSAFRKALRKLDLEPQEAVVVGDQLVTDMLGGRRVGLHTILVSPIDRSEDGLFTRLNRMIERIALYRLRRRGLWPQQEGDDRA